MATETNLEVGDIVMVLASFRIGQEVPAGLAQLLEFLGIDEGANVAVWKVRFLDDQRVANQIVWLQDLRYCARSGQWGRMEWSTCDAHENGIPERESCKVCHGVGGYLIWVPESEPVRLQRKRIKGYNMQEQGANQNGLPVVSVCRPGRWGNPYKVGEQNSDGKQRNAINAVTCFENALLEGTLPFTTDDVVAELRGKNLACFCPIGQPCHGDVLLKIANGKRIK